jgi:hypothetical protein
MLDVRIPISWLFSVFGLILIVFGAVHPLPVELTAGNQINLNLYWGILMLLFGLFMAALIKLDSSKKAD